MTTPRITLSRVARVRIFQSAGGVCHICGLKIHAERGQLWEVEHIIALSAGGTNDESNLAPAHLKPCHKHKTASEAKVRAKEGRVQANHLGIPKPGPKLPCGRMSNLRKTIKGRVIERRSQSELHHDAMVRRYGGFVDG